jgi:type IV secretion system protein VirD4
MQPGNLLIFVAGSAPIYAVQPLYFRDPVFTKRAAIAPPIPAHRTRNGGAP